MPKTSSKKRASTGFDSGSSKNTGASSEELSNEANFPPFYPIIRHSLGDLKSPLKKMCAIYAMVVWAVNAIVLLLNFVGAIVFLVLTTETTGLYMMLVSLIYIVVIPISNIILHYWPVYLACRSGNVVLYALFFISWAIGIVFNIVMIVGLPFIGSCGVLSALMVFLKGPWYIAIVVPIVMCGWILMIVLQVIGIILMYPNYKADNGNLVELQNQLFDKIKGMRAKAALGGVGNVV